MYSRKESTVAIIQEPSEPQDTPSDPDPSHSFGMTANRAFVKVAGWYCRPERKWDMDREQRTGPLFVPRNYTLR